MTEHKLQNTKKKVKPKPRLVVAPIITAIFISLLPAVVFGQEVAIKGVYLGMLKSEYEGIAMDEWTVGTHKATAESPLWFDGKLDSFTAHFDAEGFEDILAAVSHKYPGLKCVKSEMQNNFGAKLEQKTCSYKELTLKRYLSTRYFGISQLVLGKPAPTQQVLDDI
jgi:hypothetical protein